MSIEYKINKIHFNPKKILIRGIPTILIVCMVFGAFYEFKKVNRRNIVARNRMYVQDFTISLASKLNERFTESIGLLKSLAGMSYEEICPDGKPVIKQLERLEMETEFDYVRFVSKDGILYASNGMQINVSDREYYIKGMNGISSACVILDSRVTSRRQIGFYTPVKINDEIVGILVAFYDETTLRKSLEYYIYGEKAASGIVNNQGFSVVSSPSEKMEQMFEAENTRDICYLLKRKYFNDEAVYKIQNAYTTCTPTDFTYDGDLFQTIGYVCPLDIANLSVYMTFPAAATQKMYNSSYEAGRRLQIELIISFTCLILFILVYQFLQLRKEKNKNKISQYIAEAENAVSKGIVVVDLDSMTYDDYSHLNMSIPKHGIIKELEAFFLVNANSVSKTEELKKFFETEIHSSKEDISDHYPSVTIRANKNTDSDKYYSMTFVPVSEKKEKKGVILFRDVTVEKQKENFNKQYLMDALIAAEDANRAKTVFLNNMSHDIRTPMNAILGFATLMDKQKDNPEVVADYLTKIKNAGDFLLSLINNVLEMARIESGKIELNESPTAILYHKTGINDIFEGELQKKNLTLTSNYSVIHSNVYCDETKWREIYINLVSNAIKYTQNGGKIDIDFSELEYDIPNQGMYQLTVQDNGIGMSKEYLPQIFESFVRERNFTESKIQGTGLGLPIVKRLVDIMGGSITVESEQGKGSKFTVRVPLRFCDESEVQIKETGIRGEDTSFEGKTILLAEDNDLNAEIAIAILEEMGFIVERAADGAVCVEMLKKAEAFHYDLILMDVQMPNMDGYKATEVIRSLENEDKKNIPIIAMTANAFDEDKKKAIAAGMNGHLAKPINVDELLTQLHYIIK